LQQAQEMKHAVENAQIVVRSDHYRGLPCHAALADDVAVGGESFEAGIELGDVRFGQGSAHDQRAGGRHAFHGDWRLGQQPSQSAQQFVSRGSQRW
jgi:hypothetical protein